MKKYLDKLTPFHWFIIKASALYALWLFIYHTWGLGTGGFDDKFTLMTGRVAAWAMGLFGYEASSEAQSAWAMLQIDGQNTVAIGNPCNGLVIMALYAGFIIAYPGKIKIKTIFIVLGIGIIFLMNMLRIVALTFNWMYARSSFDFNHNYTFTFFVYAVVFVMWMIWANKFSTLKIQSKD
ncbi:MAG: exosortase family protein XrtF [Flammeovirgaceae bacterium]|jgi:exosortase family protein XrtF